MAPLCRAPRACSSGGGGGTVTLTHKTATVNPDKKSLFPPSGQLGAHKGASVLRSRSGAGLWGWEGSEVG